MSMSTERDFLFPAFCAVFKNELERAKKYMPQRDLNKLLNVTLTPDDIPQEVVDFAIDGFLHGNDIFTEHSIFLMREYFRNRFGLRKPVRMNHRLSARPR